VDLGNAISWVYAHRPDAEDRSSYAYYCCWDVSVRGTPERKKSLSALLAQEMSNGNRRYAANFAIALGIMGDGRAAKTLGEIMRNPGGELDPLVDYAYPNRFKALCLAGRIDIPGSEEILLKILADAGKAYVASLLKAKACDYSRYPGWVYPFSGSENGYREAAVSLAVVSLVKILSRRKNVGAYKRFEAWLAATDAPIPRIKEIRAVARSLVKGIAHGKAKS
jgi:hypothetical protein